MPIHTQFACASLRRWTSRACAVAVAVFATAASASAQTADEFLCDNSFQDCRAPIIQLIRQENVGLDVSFWFMTDTRYSSEIINRFRAGVPVRIILDTDADTNYPSNANVRQSLISAGIPIRNKVTPGINHWKMILYAGQAKVHFSAANFANGSYSPIEPYTRYVDEAVYFTNDPDLVHSFMTKFDDLWMDSVNHQNLANVTALTRNYPTYPMHSSLNFPPDQDYQDRVVSALRQETAQIDVVMFRITSAKVPDEMIRRRQAGLAIRLITDQDQYRNRTYMWHSYNIDRMYMAGIPIKWKLDDGAIEEDMHQKSIVLPTRGMAILGSSNWTSSSSDKQREHNIFSTKPWIVQWFVDQFNRKWNNLRADGTPIGTTMFLDFVPGWPETPVNVSPANMTSVASAVPLRWEGGWWAHKYDIYFGTTNPPPLIAQNYMPGSATAGVSSTKESFNPCSPPTGFTSACPAGLQPGTTYYWRIRGKTMVGDARAINGPVWSFTAGGGPPPSSDTARILADAYVRAGTSAGSNFGRTTELIAKFGADANYVRESYMKLDISSVQPGDSVRLRLVGRLSDTRAASVVTTIYPVSSTTWTETGITWNNKPAAGTTVLASWAVSGTANTLYEIDLTSHVQAQRAAGQTVMTIALKNNVDTLPYVTFGSRESGNAPRLLVGTGTASNGTARILGDTYVRAGNSADTNYGGATDLIAKRSTDPQYERQVFMKLDITDVQPDSDVTLRLFGRLSDTREATVTTDIYPVTDTGWDESSITFNDRPTAAASPAASVVVAGTSTQVYDIDLTTLAQEQRTAGHSVLGIALQNAADSLPYVAFWSRESEFKPELIVQ